jgi:hypothetical protein
MLKRLQIAKPQGKTHNSSDKANQTTTVEAPHDSELIQTELGGASKLAFTGEVTPNNILQLQRTVGNQSVLRLMAAQRGTIQRTLSEFKPSSDTITTEERRNEIKAHVTEEYKKEANLFIQAIHFYEEKFNEGTNQGNSYYTLYKNLVRGLNTGELSTLEDSIKSLAEMDKLWGGLAGVANLYKTRMDKLLRIVRGRIEETIGTDKERYEEWKFSLTQFSNINATNLESKLKTLNTWLKKREDIYDDVFSLADGARQVREAEKKETENTAWTNEFFAPKAASKLGLPGGTGQQLYTPNPDARYNNHYNWHISVAFGESGKSQHIKINRIHVTFKPVGGGGGEPRQWFNVNGTTLSLGDASGGATQAQQTFAQTKVREWATNYTGFTLTGF